MSLKRATLLLWATMALFPSSSHARKAELNGECSVYKTKEGDSCAAIAASNGLSLDELKHFNNETWGWNGCSSLSVGINICLSQGSIPLPAPISNAICGPTVPGTEKPSGDEKLADLNPCPLNACCNIWGQCGITEDYCTKSESETGNPGTAAPGKNDCISNCGTEITNNHEAPAEFRRIAYFEEWNVDRSCLRMNADMVNTSLYTHVHFAFATITDNFEVVAEDEPMEQFTLFQKLEGIKRILSFGGWGFSTDPTTYDILGRAVSKEHRDSFASNVVDYVNRFHLDGVDFDWEYPSAPGMTFTAPDDGRNYLQFLKIVKNKLDGNLYQLRHQRRTGISRPFRSKT